MKANGEVMSIHQRINANSHLVGAYQIAQTLERNGAKMTAKEFMKGHLSVFVKRYEDRFIMASKKMKRELGLIGVGKYLKKEN